MGPETWISLAALGISFILGGIQFIKSIQEIRSRATDASDAATKAEAERDRIAIQGAEGALMMMKGILEVTKLSEGELRIRVKELEADNREKDKLIRELQYKNEQLERQLANLEKRVTEQERRNDG